MGETTFDVAMACFLATHRRKPYISVPTYQLVVQAANIVKRLRLCLGAVTAATDARDSTTRGITVELEIKRI
ncbi:MAG: hypothetical protein OD815_000699 [Candidatus Alkanophagales archaeon MCA70_species_2]|nr:hypothetical protein [Candidatus Alkanophaga liquidiphilum]